MVGLKGNKSTKTYFFDTETTYTYDGVAKTYAEMDDLAGLPEFDINLVGVGRVLYGGAGLHGLGVVTFYTPEELSMFLENMSGKNVIYFHNLKFDLKFLAKCLHDSDYRNIKVMGKNSGNVISATFVLNSDEETSIELRDMIKITGKSLKESGEMFGCELKKLDFEITCADDLDKEEVREYLKIDVLLLREIYIKGLALMNKVEEELEISITRKMDLTIGAWSKKVFLRKGFPVSNTGTLFKTNLAKGFQRIYGFVDSVLDSKLRKFYYGGHGVSLMPTGKGYLPNIYYFDYSSMYPFQMIKHEYPTTKGLLIYKGFKAVNAVYSFGFYKINIKDCVLKRDRIPSIVSGKKYNDDISLLTSIDNDTTLYVIDHYGTRSDYKNLLKDYLIGEYQVEESIMMMGEKMPETFVNAVKYIYSLKEKYKETNKSLSGMFKILLNSFYGKIGQGFVYNQLEFIWNDEKNQYKLVQRCEEKEENPDSQLSVAVASCITMFARNELLTLADMVGHKNVCLTATDALVFLKNDETNKVIPTIKAIRPFEDTKIGTIGEDAIYNFALQGTKSYQYHTIKKDKEVLITKCAGMPEKVKQSLNWLWWNGEPVSIMKSITINGGAWLKHLLFTPSDTPSFVINSSYKEELRYD